MDFETSQRLITARTNYLDKAIAELQTVANLIDNSDPEKHDFLVKISMLAGEAAQQAFSDYRSIAATIHPQNPALSDIVANEN